MAKSRKVPEMPILAPKDGEIERKNAYTRLNPSGDEEFVIKRVGKQDAETLNELAMDLLDLLESVEFANSPAMFSGQSNSERNVNQPNPPQLVASRGDPARAAGETLTNIDLNSAPADGPELARVRSPLRSNARGNESTSKYISHGNGMDLGATHSESLTCTGAIAIAPAAFGSPPSKTKKRRSGDKDTNTSRVESNMGAGRNPKMLAEWLPTFKGAGYNPGEHAMPEPDGKGVAERTPTSDTVGEYDTDTSAFGKEWPRHHNDTPAMCDVDENGVENKPQGTHESTHAEADDGIQDEVGHNWPDQPKNSGQGVAEKFEGSRWSDGGTLESSSMSSDSSGEITNESWSPARMAQFMGEEVDLQALFDSYARTASAVCLEDFQNLCDAHGCDAILDESSLLHLMGHNQEFMFHENRDADGSYWTASAITEGENGPPFASKGTIREFFYYRDADSDPKEKKCQDCGCVGGDCDTECPKCGSNRMQPDEDGRHAGGMRESTARRGRTIREFQERTPEEEANFGKYDDLSDVDDLDSLSGDPDVGSMMTPHGGSSDPLDAHEELGGRYDERLGEMGEMDDYGGVEGGTGMSGLECPGCGYQGEEAECPECGAEMMDALGEDVPGELAGEYGDVPEMLGHDKASQLDELPSPEDDNYDPMYNDKASQEADFFEPEGERKSPPGRAPYAESRQTITGPRIVESLKRFMTSARSMIERNPQARQRDLAEALNHSWRFHAGNVDAHSCPSNVQQTLQGLMNKFPGFSPLLENEGMDGPEGSKLNGGDGPKDNLPKQPVEMTTHGEKNLLGKRQTNNLDGTPVIAGTGRGLTGRSTNESAIPGQMASPPAAGAAPATSGTTKPAAQGAAAPATSGTAKPAAQGAAAPAAQGTAKPAAQGTAAQGAPAAPGTATQAVQENIARLNSHVKKSIAEGARTLRGKYDLVFSVAVSESKDDLPDFIKDKMKKRGSKKGKKGKKKNRTPPRDNLAEALADAEELLQIHSPEKVTFETTFLGPQGRIALKQDTPLFTIMPRGPLVGEGKALFRFNRTAEAFADQLTTEGVTCRITAHNWGSAVQAQTNYATAARAFTMISENRQSRGKLRVR